MKHVARHTAIRASDADRDSVADRLRAATVEGRIDAGELEQRLHVALRARTYGELQQLLDDLPATPGPWSGRRRRGLARPTTAAAVLAMRLLAFVVVATVVIALMVLAAAWWLLWVVMWFLVCRRSRRRFPPPRRRRRRARPASNYSWT